MGRTRAWSCEHHVGWRTIDAGGSTSGQDTPSSNFMRWKTPSGGWVGMCQKSRRAILDLTRAEGEAKRTDSPRIFWPANCSTRHHGREQDVLILKSFLIDVPRGVPGALAPSSHGLATCVGGNTYTAPRDPIRNPPRATSLEFLPEGKLRTTISSSPIKVLWFVGCCRETLTSWSVPVPNIIRLWW